MRRLPRALVVLSLAMVLLTACAAPAPKTAPAPADATDSGSTVVRKSLKVGYLNVMDDAQAMLAKDAGFYEQQGLDVELVLFSSGTDLVKAMVGGKLNAGVLGFTNAATWAAQGADVKVVGGAQMGYHSILVNKGSGIKSVADLKGKRLASQKAGSTADIVLNGVVLPQAGLSREDLKMVYVEPSQALQSLAAGQVDAAFVFEPYEQMARATADVEVIYEIGKVWPFPCMVVLSTGEQLKEDRDAIDRLLSAQKQAIDMLETRPQEAAQLLVSRFMPADALTDPAKKAEAVEIIARAVDGQSFHWEITDQDVQRMEEIVGMMADQGVLKQKVDVRQLLDLAWQEQQTAEMRN